MPIESKCKCNLDNKEKIQEINSALNIFDLSGNVFEWTLENNTNINTPCVLRGGISGTEGTDLAIGRNGASSSSGGAWSGSRISLFKN